MRLIQYFAMLIAVTLSSAVYALEWGEGYDPIDPPAPVDSGDKIEVVEFFWYGCPHCYTLDPYVTEWLKSKPENVEFKHIPVPLNPTWTPHTHFFYAAEALGVIDKLHGPLFDALHKDKRRIYDKKSLVKFAVDHGVDEKELLKAWNSFAVSVKVKRAKKLGQSYRISGVPAVGINGKYKTSGSLAGTYPKMLEIIDQLIDKESQALAK